MTRKQASPGQDLPFCCVLVREQPSAACVCPPPPPVCARAEGCRRHSAAQGHFTCGLRWGSAEGQGCFSHPLGCTESGTQRPDVCPCGEQAPHRLEMQTEAHRSGCVLDVGQGFHMGLVGAARKGGARMRRRHWVCSRGRNIAPFKLVPCPRASFSREIPYTGSPRSGFALRGAEKPRRLFHTLPWAWTFP